jgi:hypothetical protein
MIKEIGFTPALVRKAGWVTSGLLVCAIAVVGVSKSHGSVKDAEPFPLLTAQDVYAVQSSYLKQNEAPWLFDGERSADGKIVAIWDADTDANKAACANEWKASTVYRPLCMELQSQKIISVEVAGLTTRVVTYVPVSRIAKLDVSDQVRIRMGDISGDAVTHALPSFVRVVR